MRTDFPRGRSPGGSILDTLRPLRGSRREAALRSETPRPMLQHLEELRHRLFKIVVALLAGIVVSSVFAERMIAFLARPVGGLPALVSIEVTENVGVFVRVSLLGGVVLAMPVLVYQLLRFVVPGLTGRERRHLLPVVPLASGLFLAGAGFAWWVLLPRALPFLTGFLGIATQVRPESYFRFVTSILFWMGVSFEMPLVVVLLVRLGVVSASTLARGWRYAVVALSVAAAVITPTVDPFNMGLVMLPLLALYGLSIALAFLLERG